jgi:hypothetical protein
MLLRILGNALVRTFLPGRGTKRIRRSVRKFDKMASAIQSAAEVNRRQIQANNREIADLQAENIEIEAALHHGESVAGKLRNLIA